MDEFLHIYGQYSFHTEAAIVGDRKSLTKLRDLIDRALVSKPKKSKDDFFANDGEGYTVHVIETTDDPKIARPYTDEIAKDNREDAIWPWQFWIAKGQNPVEPVVLRRLSDGRKAFDLPEPKTLAQAKKQLEQIGDGIRALQSLDELGGELDREIAEKERFLQAKYKRLEKWLKEYGRL